MESTLSIEAHWLRIEYQIETLRQVWDKLDNRLQVHQNHVLSVLQKKLQIAVDLLDGLVGENIQDGSAIKKTIYKSGGAKRLKYASHAKESLNCVIEDLEKWERIFDPSWFLLARIANGQRIAVEEFPNSHAVRIIGQLRRAHNENQQGIHPTKSWFSTSTYRTEDKKPVAFTSATMVRGASLVLDPIPIKTYSNFQSTARAARDLARILAEVEPKLFCLLRCQGLIRISDGSQRVSGFEFAFPMPPACDDPSGLRSFLLDVTHPTSLTHRLSLAKSMARSVIFLHSAQIVHKNIRPETVIIIKESSSNVAGTPYLIGFDQFRFADSHTYMVGDSHWERNLYRHPKRQGEYPEEEYQMQHDIYSLGVCLLEIGLWQSFVYYELDDEK